MPTAANVKVAKVDRDLLDQATDRFGQDGDTIRDLLNRVIQIALDADDAKQSPQPITSELAVSDISWEPEHIDALPFETSPTAYQDQIDELRSLVETLSAKVVTVEDDTKYAIELAGSATQQQQQLVKRSSDVARTLNKWKTLPCIADDLAEARATRATSTRTRKASRRPSSSELEQQGQDLGLYEMLIGDE